MSRVPEKGTRPHVAATRTFSSQFLITMSTQVEQLDSNPGSASFRQRPLEQATEPLCVSAF